MKRVYVILAIVGAILPYVFLTQFFIHEGLKLTGFLSALFANPPALGFMSDLLFTSFVFWIMMMHDQKHGGAGLGWPLPRFREIVARVPFENRDALEMIAQNSCG